MEVNKHFRASKIEIKRIVGGSTTRLADDDVGHFQIIHTSVEREREYNSSSRQQGSKTLN